LAKTKKLTNKEKKYNAQLKKQMQEKGILPPDKPRLNRKKFIEEAKAEWQSRDMKCLWDVYLVEAISYMLIDKEGISRRASLEAVGAAKILKLAVRLRKFTEMVRERGDSEYKVIEQYEYIKDILYA